MLRRNMTRSACAAAVLAFGTVALAQTGTVKERFTFLALNGSKAGPAGGNRLELVVNRWSNDAERDRVYSVLADSGQEKLADAVAALPEAGYISWPGNLEYIVRYAHRIPRSDGGEDVVLAADAPMNLWWDPAISTPSSSPRFTVIQLRLGKDGRGEGKLSLATKATANKETKTFALEDYAKQPAILTDVQRERTSS
jgi:hypothetical protein